MPDHKLEPGQLVLVRDGVDETWMLRQFSYFDEENCLPFRVMPDTGWKQCIPFNAETKHLQNTTQPYVSVADAPHGDRQISATEISQEERDLWRFEASDECGTHSDEDERILRLLAAFEACESDLERSCEETRANFSELYRMANEVVPELKRRIADAEAQVARLQQHVNELVSEELTDGAIRERIQLRHNMHEVLQENERLTKERDWLATQLACIKKAVAGKGK